jgi:predicted transcriptional regulator
MIIHFNDGERSMSAFTVRLTADQVKRLDLLAEKTSRSRSYISAKAIELYVLRETAQIEEIEAGLAEAKAGDFASEAEVAAVLEKYGQALITP